MARAARGNHCPGPLSGTDPLARGTRKSGPNSYFLPPQRWVQAVPPGTSGDPDGRGSTGSKATGPRAVPCKLGTSLSGAKNPHPDPIFLLPTFFPHKTKRNDPPGPQAGGLLAGAPAVAVALLLVGPVRGVPLQQVGVVGQHHLDGLQRLGDGSLLQGPPLLRERAGQSGGQHSRPAGRILHRCTEGGRHAEPTVPGSPTHPHGQGEYAAAAEPRRSQRTLAAARHRDVALLVITCGRARRQRHRSGRTLALRVTRPHSPSPHFPQMRISFMGPDVFPRQTLHLGSSPGTPAAGRVRQSWKRARRSHVSVAPGRNPRPGGGKGGKGQHSPCWMSFQRTQYLELSSNVTRQLCLEPLTCGERAGRTAGRQLPFPALPRFPW